MVAFGFALVLLVALIVGMACLMPASTAPITDAQGKPLPGSIAVPPPDV